MNKICFILHTSRQLAAGIGRVGFIIALAIFSLCVSTVYADTPVVNSFTVTPSLESGQAADLDWNITGGGHSLIIFCAQGIKMFYANNGQPFLCDSRVSISNSASDSVSIVMANVSGSARIVTARIIPKDSNGAVDYNAGAKEATIYINPSNQTVGTFYTTATSTFPDTDTNFYWSSMYLDGVNFRIACNDSITATSTLYGDGNIPCNRMIFPTDLLGSGSVSFRFNNHSTVDLPLEITLFPSMSPGIYDGIHAKTITLTVASSAPKPISARFGASRSKIFSGDSILFDWSVLNGGGANFKFTCSPSLELRAFSQSTTTTIGCGDYAWKVPLASVGSTSVTFISSSMTDEVSSVTFFPLLKSGIYDGNNSQMIRVNVAPVPKTPQVLIPVGTSTAGSNTIQISPTLPVSGKNVFNKSLAFGSRSDDVKLLQKYLAKDRTLYPEGLVTGYFGVATKRAVGRFQLKFGLIKNAKDPSYGVLDTKTRLSLNAFQ